MPASGNTKAHDVAASDLGARSACDRKDDSSLKKRLPNVKIVILTISDDDAERAAAVFRALSDPARVKLMALIRASGEDGSCVCDLVAAVGRSQATVSHHLRLLLEAGLVARERSGTWAYYSFRPEALAVMREALVL